MKMKQTKEQSRAIQKRDFENEQYAKCDKDGDTMTEEEANDLVFGDFADEISLYGLGDIGNK